MSEEEEEGGEKEREGGISWYAENAVWTLTFC